MKKTIVLALFTLTIAVSFATIWHVNNNAGIVADFSTLDAAFASAQVVAGDTLYIYGSAVSYSPPALTKRLTLIGPGYYLSQNTGLQYSQLPAYITSLTLDPGSEGSLVSGFMFDYCYVNAASVVVQRNKIRRLDVTLPNCLILQNYFYETFNYVHAIHLNGATNVVVANNWIHFSPGGWCIYMEDNSSGTFYNNCTWGSCRYRNAEVYNCIIDWDGNGWEWSFNFDSNSNLHHNVLMSIGSWDWNNYLSDPTNVYNVTAQVFVQTGSYDASYQLCAGSPAIGAGVSGADCGMFGGSTPYKLSGIPAIPTIYNFSAPATGFTIPIQIGARSNN